MSAKARYDSRTSKMTEAARSDFSAFCSICRTLAILQSTSSFGSTFLENVRNGHLQPGQAIPSKQRIAELLEFSRTTVRHTLCGAEREGFVRRVQGKGTFIHEEARKRLRKQLDVSRPCGSQYGRGLVSVFARRLSNGRRRRTPAGNCLQHAQRSDGAIRCNLAVAR